MKLSSDHAGKSQENQNNNNNNKNRIKFIGEKKKAPDKNENYHHCPQAVRGRRSLPRSSLFPFAVVSRGCVPGCARRGSGGGGGGSGSLRRGPRCGPAHVTAAGVAPDPARIGLLPAGGVGIRPAGSAPGGGDAPFGSPLERGRGRREDGGRMRPTRTTRVTPSLLTPSHLQPQGWRCPPAPGLGVAPRFIFPGFLRCPSGRRCSPTAPPPPPHGSWFLAGTSGEHTETFPTGLSDCRGRGEALFCSERELPLSFATKPRIPGTGTGVSPAGPPPLRAHPQRRVVPPWPGRCSQPCPGLRAAPAPHRPVGALPSPFPPRCPIPGALLFPGGTRPPPRS